MTRIEAVIQPHEVEEVKHALAGLGLLALTATEVKGFSRRGGPRGHDAPVPFDLRPTVKLEVVVPTPFVPRVLDTLERAMRGPRTDEARFIASPVDEAVRIRTGERGERAL